MPRTPVLDEIVGSCDVVSPVQEILRDRTAKLFDTINLFNRRVRLALLNKTKLAERKRKKTFA